MKKTLVVALILFLVFSLLIGCQSNEIKRLDSVQEINIEKLVEYKDSYTLNKQSFRITRKELETLYGRDLREYSNDILAWKKEVIDSSEKIEEFLGE